MKFLLKIIDRIGVFLSGFYLKNSTKINQDYLNERVIEYSFVLNRLLAANVRKIADIGTGTNSFSSTLQHCGFDVTASDLMGGYWKSYQNRHIHVCQDDITSTSLPRASFDAVTCISTLEHIPEYNAALEGMTSLLKDNGSLIISFPYSHDTFCENVYQLDSADELAKNFRYIARSYSDSEIDSWCKNYNLVIVDTLYIKGWEGKFWRSGKRINSPLVTINKEEANCICLHFKKIA